MNMIREIVKRIGTVGLAVIILVTQGPVTVFADELTGTGGSVVMDGIPVDEVSPSGQERADEPETTEDRTQDPEAVVDQSEDPQDPEVIVEEPEDPQEPEVIVEEPEDPQEPEAAEDETEEPKEAEENEDPRALDENDDKDPEAETTDGEIETEEDSSRDKKLGQDENIDDAEEDKSYPPFEETISIDDVKITVTADEGAFPEGALLSVEKVTKAREKEVEEAVENERPDGQNVAISYTYDIKVLDDKGEELQPANEQKVKVSFELPHAADENLSANVYHISETEDKDTDETDTDDLSADAQNETETETSEDAYTVEKLEADTDADEETITVETEGFSFYIVEFTYGDLQYVMEGDSSVRLATIVSSIGLKGDAGVVSVSNEELFSASRDGGEWIITAHKPFSSQEWMNISIDGVEYRVTVTDDSDIVLITSWSQMRDQADKSSNNNKTLRLDADIYANGKDRILIKNKTLTIDLNGHTMDRQRTKTDSDGHVIEIQDGAKVTIKDSSPSKTGLITGGYAKRGGGIHIGKGTTCIIEGGTIKNNKSSIDGGGIYIRGTLKMTGGTVTDNYAEDTAGGIYCVDTGTFDIANARITNNRAKNDGGGFVVHLKSNAAIRNCVISGNKTDKDDGGALRMDANGKNLNIDDTEISDNVAADKGGAMIVENGRVLMNGGSVKNNKAIDGGGVYNEETIVFDNVEISGNISTEKGGAGVCNKNDDAILRNCIIKNNVSNDRGGGVYAGDDITLEGCTFEGNTSTDDGGGVCFNDVDATVRNCTFKGNKTNCSGGAIHIEDGKINVIDTTITDQNSADDYGGGICIDDDADVYFSGTNVITKNKAKDGGGGMSVGYDTDIAGIKDTLIVKDNECKSGSDVYLRYINETKLFESIKIYERKYEWAWLTLTGRLNTDSHIGIFTQQPFTYLSSDITEDYGKYHGEEDPARYFIAEDGYNVVISSEKEAFISVSNWSSLQRQIDDAAEGATITIDKNWQALPDDKNLRIPAGKTITIDLNGYTIDRNRLSKDAKDAGEVFTVYGTLIVTDSSEGGTGKICGGHGNCGGGVYVHKGGSFTLAGGNIEGNKAKNGGGIYNYLGNVVINGGNVSGNSAAADGGGVYNAKAQGSDTGTSTLTLSGGKITNNDAQYQAGGVYLADDSTLKVEEKAYVGGNNAATGKNILLFDDNCIDVTGLLTTGDTDGNNALLDFSVKQNRTGSSGEAVPDKQITRGLGSNSGMQAFTYNGREAAYSETSTPVCVTGGDLYLKGSRPDDDAIPISSWKSLYETLRNGSNEGRKFYIATDLKANKDHHEEIEVKINVEIDLNGRFVDRNRYKGSVFRVKDGKTLTIKDSGGTGTICGGVGDDDGGGFYVEDNATLVMTGGTIANNGADETGGGIYCSNGGTLQLDGVTISHNTADWRGGGLRLHLKDDYSYISNCIISSNTTEDSGENYGGGGISISAQNKTLTITDTVISDNTATNGGGIFAYDGSKLVLTGVTISGNSTTKYGGAGINNTDSTITLSGCTIRGNTSNTTGGGIWASGGSTTTITGSTITANHAKTSGGGMHTFGTTIINGGTKISGNNATDSAGGVLAETDLQISGKVEIVENLDGQNVCLKNNKKLVTGILDPASSIGVGIINSQTGNKGVFTSGFAANNPSVDPAVIFYSDDGYSVYKTEDGNEAEIRLEISDGGDFIDWTSQITDTSGLTPKNWMSGISGDRYLNEINLPCTHDSSMNSIKYYRMSSVGSLMGYSKNAKTQIRYINEQMNEGVRRLDIRLTRFYEYSTNYGTDIRPGNDGYNLYNNHGKDKTGGSFWAKDPDGNLQTFSKVLSWVKEFLREHPTEVIILDLQPEVPGIYVEKEDIPEEEDDTYYRAWDIIDNEINNETNPTTGKPYVYWRNGAYNKFTSFPQLKECRGQVIFKCDGNRYIGGLCDTTIYPVVKSYGPNGGGTGCSAAEKITVVRKFLDRNAAPPENIVDIPKDVTNHLNRFYSASVLAAPVNSMGIPTCTPLEAAEKIQNALFYNGGLFDQRGQYVGWIRQDGVNAQLNRYIWASNFPGDLNYVTVTAQSGSAGAPAQTYKLLKGTHIIIPGNIYGSNKELSYWKANVPSGTETDNDADYVPGNEYIVNKNVTFTAIWGGDVDTSQTKISTVWVDDDESGRPADLTVTYKPESSENSEDITLSATEGWEKNVSGRVKEVLSVNCPEDYSYKVTKNGPSSWIITMTLQPKPFRSLSGSIIWNDYDNADGKRPSDVELHLYDSTHTEVTGNDLAPLTVTQNEDEWSWSFNLSELNTDDAVESFSVVQVLPDAATDEYTSAGEYDENVGKYIITNTLKTQSHTHNSTNLKHVSGEDVSCIKDGNKEYWYCDSCGKCFWDENGNSEITDAEKDTIIIPATGHRLERHAAQNPTCREDGNTEYWQCENCGAYFSDENAEHKVNPDKIQTKGGIIIHSTGHSWRRPTYTWSEDMTAVTAESVCDNDHSHVQEDTAKVTSKTEEPSCETSGETVYTAAFKNGIFDDQEKTEVIPALGHSFGEWVVIEKPEKLKQRTCKRCGKVETIGIKQYAVDVIVDGHGTATASPKAAEEKKTIKLTATADKGYEFKEWTSSDGVKFADAASASTTFTMPAKDVTVRASFEKAAESPVETEKTYTISVKTVGNGTATACKARAKAGKKITIKAASMAGYKFRKWKVTEGVKLKDEKKASTSFVMPAKNVTVKAIFEKIYEVPQPEIEPVDDDKIMFAWWKVNEAEGYDIFMSRCNHGGRKTTPKLVKTIKGNKTFSWEAKGLKTSKSYKAYVKAYVIKDGKKKYVSKSPLVHAYTSGGNKTYTNAKSIKIDTTDGKIKKNKLTLKVKDTYKIKAGVVKADKKKKLMSDSHVKTLRYRSSDPGIATVGSSGKITARKKGKCKIYVYAHNGVNKTIKVTVK